MRLKYEPASVTTEPATLKQLEELTAMKRPSLANITADNVGAKVTTIQRESSLLTTCWSESTQR
jgi:hypothetical protein